MLDNMSMFVGVEKVVNSNNLFSGKADPDWWKFPSTSTALPRHDTLLWQRYTLRGMSDLALTREHFRIYPRMSSAKRPIDLWAKIHQSETAGNS